MFQLAVTAGLRVGELIALQVRDVTGTEMSCD
jgi:integrase